VDPVLRGNLGGILVGDNVELDEEIAREIFDGVSSPLQLPSDFDIPGDEFIEFMSKINIVKNSLSAKRGF
jgi:hypothetical protein